MGMISSYSESNHWNRWESFQVEGSLKESRFSSDLLRSFNGTGLRYGCLDIEEPGKPRMCRHSYGTRGQDARIAGQISFLIIIPSGFFPAECFSVRSSASPDTTLCLTSQISPPLSTSLKRSFCLPEVHTSVTVAERCIVTQFP